MPCAVGPGGNFLYVANSASNDLSIFSINTGTGLLNPLGTVPTGVAPYGIVVDPTGSYLYVSNYSSNDISAYAINASSGALTEISGSPFPVGVAPTSLKTDPSGQFLYVANSGSRSVSVLQLDSATGALSDVAGSPFAAGIGPISIAIDPTGAFAYVANASRRDDFRVFDQLLHRCVDGRRGAAGDAIVADLVSDRRRIPDRHGRHRKPTMWGHSPSPARVP